MTFNPSRSLAAALAATVVFAATPRAAAQWNDAGAIESFYFDTLGYTEVWINLSPPPRPGEPMSPVTLNLTVRLPGKVLQNGPARVAPLAVLARARSNDLYNPAFVRQPRLVMNTDGEPAWDPELAVNFFAQAGPSCWNCGTPADSVEVEIPVGALERLGSAMEVTGNALGFEFALSASQVDTVREFATRVAGQLSDASASEPSPTRTPLFDAR